MLVMIKLRIRAELIFTRPINILAMEMLEAIGWIVLGFVPTLAAMEAAWMIGKRRLTLAEVGVH